VVVAGERNRNTRGPLCLGRVMALDSLDLCVSKMVAEKESLLLGDQMG